MVYSGRSDGEVATNWLPDLGKKGVYFFYPVDDPAGTTEQDREPTVLPGIAVQRYRGEGHLARGLRHYRQAAGDD